MSTAAYQGVFDYLGLSRFSSRCGLTILPQPEDKVIVILSELAANPGASITNRYAGIATAVYEEFLSHVPVQGIAWIEHYNRDSYSNNADSKETFAEVNLTWNERKKAFYAPQWHPCSKAMVESMLDSLELFDDDLSVVNTKGNRQRLC